MESNLYNFLQTVLNDSVTFAGRFVIAEGYGNDLNADNNDDVLVGNAVNAQPWSKKYPCVVAMPMVEVGENVRNNTTRGRIALYFLTKSFSSGNGVVKNKNPQTNTSRTPIKADWEQMRDAAKDFYQVCLDKMYGDIAVRQTVRPVKAAPPTWSRVSMRNNDGLSGVVGTFEFDLVKGCEVNDYINNQVTIADYVTFNSDTFLLDLIDDGKAYRYTCDNSFMFNGQNITTSETVKTYTQTDIRFVPVQEGERITIPKHIELGLHYDHNWIDFLQSLPIAQYITFRPSPFCDYDFGSGKLDPGYPVEVINSAVTSVHNETVYIYGEGFQIEWPRGATFSFTVRYYYRTPSNQWRLDHTIIFTEAGMTIDGAAVAYANKKDIDEYVA